jgi:hypothetical protein
MRVGEESRGKMRMERFYLALLWNEVAFDDYPNKKKIRGCRMRNNKNHVERNENRDDEAFEQAEFGVNG